MATSQHLAIMNETPVNTSAGTAQLQASPTQQLISQLSNVVQPTWLTGGYSQISTSQPQVIMSDADNVHVHSTEVLSEVFNNAPIHAPLIINDNPHTSTTDNMHHGFTEPLVSATQNSLVSLPAIPSWLRDEIYSGEFIDFASLLLKAMYSRLPLC